MHKIILALLCVASTASAQSLAQRVTATDGTVQVIYPSRGSVCGDGQSYIGNLFGRSTYYTGNSITTSRNDWPNRTCVAGPARALVTVISGEVTRLRAYVGPVPSSDVRTLSTTAMEASAWLSDLIARANTKVASDAMLPLVLADAADPWPMFLRVARDETRPLGTRRAALQWLATGVSDRLGLTDDDGDTDDDEMRKQAVFVLSQRPKAESVPELIDVARSSKRPAVRRSAIFWLGQSGDLRVADLFADLLKLR